MNEMQAQLIEIIMKFSWVTHSQKQKALSAFFIAIY